MDNIELNDDLIEQLFEKVSGRDHRYVNKALLEAFCSGKGIFHEFLKFIKKHNRTASSPNEKLALLLRGNGNQIIIYWHNHKLWELSLNKSGKGKVVFDYNHARYMKNWKHCLEELKTKYGFCVTKSRDITKNNNQTNCKIGKITSSQETFSQEFVEETFEIFSKMIDNFLGLDKEDEKRTDYFATELSEEKNIKIENNNVRIHLEKCWQHRLFFELKNTDNGYYVYDLEFSQPYPGKNDIISVVGENGYNSGIKTDKVKEKWSVNEPDMLAIRFEHGIPKAIVFIEVKCTNAACRGKSGLKNHLKGMEAYANKEIFRKTRIKDAEECLKQYQKMGFLDSKIEIPNLEGLGFEILLVLTTATDKNGKDAGAIKYYNNNKNEVDSWIKDCEMDCKIMTINNKYNDYIIDITCLE